MTMMIAALNSEKIIPALSRVLRERASFARRLASRLSRRARRMGMVDGMD
jgi:hypothetical protein